MYTLENSGENKKISEVKNFVENANKSTPYKVQIFFIQNITNMTLQASNSLLKFFEEPGKQNIIFLSAK
ncbi:DNA polymerase III subunit delta', partial [Candidatus Gracilibacteria bacterium]|nr:DNA polymerase III subunit delta' [Candidatus Gracilibacteria bacterium]